LNTWERAWARVQDTFLDVRSVLSELKKLSIAELFQTSSARLTLQVMPCSLSSCWQCSLVYWLPWTPLYVSSDDFARVYLALPLLNDVEDFASHVALETADGLGLELLIEHLLRHSPTCTAVFRQASTSRSSAQGVFAHYTLDTVQVT
jgi:hypothetical protein